MEKRIVISIFLVCIVLFFVSVFFVSKQYNTDVQEEVFVSSTMDAQIDVQENSRSEIEKVIPTPVSPTQQVPKKEEKKVIKDQVQQEKPQTVSILSSLDARTILETHNKERSVAGVAPLVWSASLALQAQSWTDSLSVKCIPSHASSAVRNGKGENIWAGYGYDVWNVSEMVNDWILEKQNYTYDTNTCAPGVMCGHYTQVVWNTTTEIGCGITTCSEGGDEGKILVCRYGSAGNISNKKPY